MFHQLQVFDLYLSLLDYRTEYDTSLSLVSYRLDDVTQSCSSVNQWMTVDILTDTELSEQHLTGPAASG